MARPRTFDEQAVLAAAREAMWSAGVNATSVRDLREATGLSASSLYGAFGSKADLTLATLDDYLTSALAMIAERFEVTGGGLAAIEDYLALSATMASADGPTRGCYSVVCATELAATDPAVADRLRRHDDEIRALLRTELEVARARGELAGDPEAGARLIATTVNGIQVDARKGIDHDTALTTLRLALDALR